MLCKTCPGKQAVSNMADVFDKLDVTPDEISRLTKAMKDEKFRQMLCEYAQELQDPENRRKYEEEIAMLEQNRGMDVTFLNPTPGYVLKTNNGEKKVFINLCQCDKIAGPKAVMGTQDKNGVTKAGVNWTMPYSLAPGREDFDKGGKTCMVYDVIFHPKSFESGNKDPRLKNLMETTALDGIEREFKEKLDRTNLKRPKMKFKGQPQSTVIRTPKTGGALGGTDALSDLNLPYPYDDNQPAKNGAANPPAKSPTKISGSRSQTKKSEAEKITEKNGPTQPKYTLTHRGHFDMQNFTNARDSQSSTRPQELIVRVELPLLKSAAPVQLDVYEKQIVLECKKPAAYKLDLQLPYPVDDENGSAKFDKSKACLTITLPVLPPAKMDLPSFEPENETTPSLIEEIPSGDGTDSVTSTEGTLTTEQVPEVRNDLESEKKNDQETGPTASDDKESGKETNQSSSQGLDSDDDEHPATDHLDNQASPQSALINEVICPAYTFKQDSDTVIFVIQKPNIITESVQKNIDLNHSSCEVKVQFRTSPIDQGKDAALYCLDVEFDRGCVINETMVEVTTEGAVLVMVKDASCRGEWSGFRAGSSADSLKEKKFLTEENIHDAVAKSNDESKTAEPIEMEVASAKVTDQILVAEFKRTKKEDETPARESSDITKSTMESANDTEVKSPAADVAKSLVEPIEDSSPHSLKLDLQSNDVGSATMSSDASPPLTPDSTRSLKSALRRARRIEHTKSVSFSESVEVEVLVSPGKTKKGKQRPLVAKRRIESLKGESKGRRRRYHSDSEVSYNPSGGTECFMEDFSEDFKKILPDNKRTRNRHSSSESESGPDDRHQTAKSSTKKPTRGGAKKQRKKQQKAKRELEFDNQRKQDDSQDSGDPESPCSPPAETIGSVMNGKKEDSNCENGGEGVKQDNCQDSGDPESPCYPPVETIGSVMNGKKEDTNCENGGEGLKHDDNNNKEVVKDGKMRTKENLKNEDEVPLEYQDHSTKSEVAFQNEVVFELDD